MDYVLNLWNENHQILHSFQLSNLTRLYKYQALFSQLHVTVQHWCLSVSQFLMISSNTLAQGKNLQSYSINQCPSLIFLCWNSDTLRLHIALGALHWFLLFTYKVPQNRTPSYLTRLLHSEIDLLPPPFRNKNNTYVERACKGPKTCKGESHDYFISKLTF